MKKDKIFQRLAAVAMMLALFGAVSAFADDRSDRRTYRDDDRNYGRSERDLVGVVERVARDGDSFVLNSNRQRIEVHASGGVPVYDRGRRMRIRDLDRGDRVAVDLVSASLGRARARSVEVLSSQSTRRGDNRYNDRYNDRYDDRNRGRSERLEGMIRSYDERRGLMVLETRSGRDLVVSTERLARGDRRFANAPGLRGRVVIVQGYSNGRVFIAEDIDLVSRGRGNDRRW